MYVSFYSFTNLNISVVPFPVNDYRYKFKFSFVWIRYKRSDHPKIKHAFIYANVSNIYVIVFMLHLVKHYKLMIKKNPFSSLYLCS